MKEPRRAEVGMTDQPAGAGRAQIETAWQSRLENRFRLARRQGMQTVDIGPRRVQRHQVASADYRRFGSVRHQRIANPAKKVRDLRALYTNKASLIVVGVLPAAPRTITTRMG